MKEKTTIRLAPLDAGLVLRCDGTFEAWLPHVHEKPPRNALAMSALMFAYHQPRLMRLIEDAMEAAGFEYLDPPPPPSATGERSDLV